MKKFSAFILCSLLVLTCLTGCSQPGFSTEMLPSVPFTTEAPEPIDYASPYLNIIADYEKSIGIGPADGIHMIKSGLYYARLLDFDNSGVPELILGYIKTEGENTGVLYSIYAMIGNEAVCVDSGNMYTAGGVDPYIHLAFTDEQVYFVTGTSQWAFNTNYRSFNGESFTTVFHHSGNHDGDYYVNGNPATAVVHESAVNTFKADITKTDVFRLGDDYATTIATINDTKSTLLKLI